MLFRPHILSLGPRPRAKSQEKKNLLFGRVITQTWLTPKPETVQEKSLDFQRCYSHLFILLVLQSSQVKRTPQDAIKEFIIPKLNPLVLVAQIHLCILACVMSCEFTREAVTKFLPAQFPWIWCKCLLRNFIHSKIFNLSKYREVLVTYSLLITHAESRIEFDTSYGND